MSGRSSSVCGCIESKILLGEDQNRIWYYIYCNITVSDLEMMYRYEAKLMAYLGVVTTSGG